MVDCEQPNNMFARSCEVDSDFTVYGMTREEAILLCREAGLGYMEAEENVRRAERSPKRYSEVMQTIAKVHGVDLRKERGTGASVT